MNKGIFQCSFLILLLALTCIKSDDTTKKYLENTVRSLRQLSNRGINNRRSHEYEESVPPLTFTKGELAAMYEQALKKGETLEVDTGNQEYVHALVHHLNEDHEEKLPPKHHDHHPVFHPPNNHDDHPSFHPPNSDDPPHEPNSEDAGYYYYYYPIKSFLDAFSSQPSEEPASVPHPHHQHTYHTSTYKPPFQYHSHHHHHNVTITAEIEKKDNKSLDNKPIMMAISGFVMAAMFVLSMIILPKIKATKPKEVNKLKNDRFDDFARLAINAIEGRCAERFACELTRTARSFEDNRFFKFLQRVAPGTFGRYMKDSSNFTDKQLKCRAIPCKKINKLINRTNNNNNNNRKKKPQHSNKKY